MILFWAILLVWLLQFWQSCFLWAQIKTGVMYEMNFQDIGVALSVLGAVGWIFKIWIINPLNISILTIKDTCAEFKSTIEKYRQMISDMAQEITAARADAKSAHKRISELQERVHALEMRCLECCRRDD